MLTYSMGGPTIDSGSYDSENQKLIRYTPPVPEFEVFMLNIDPGETLQLENPGVPSIMMIIEGSGVVDGEQVRPGKAYYWPASSESLEFKIGEDRRGPLKVAVAHRNCHLMNPTSVNRDNFGLSSHHNSQRQLRVSVPASPMPYQGIPHISPTHMKPQPNAPEDFEAPMPYLN